MKAGEKKDSCLLVDFFLFREILFHLFLIHGYSSEVHSFPKSSPSLSLSLSSPFTSPLPQRVPLLTRSISLFIYSFSSFCIRRVGYRSYPYPMGLTHLSQGGAGYVPECQMTPFQFFRVELCRFVTRNTVFVNMFDRKKCRTSRKIRKMTNFITVEHIYGRTLVRSNIFTNTVFQFFSLFFCNLSGLRAPLRLKLILGCLH